jgi:hypothetical protein
MFGSASDFIAGWRGQPPKSIFVLTSRVVY